MAGDPHPVIVATPTKATVDALAAYKRLDARFLRRLGLRDAAEGVIIPYVMSDGSPARCRRRLYVETSHPTMWHGHGPMQPYIGARTLSAARERGELVFVEGESDVWTLAAHRIPALGVPGASMVRLVEREHVEGVARVLVNREPGPAGSDFPSAVAVRLHALQWTGKVLAIDLQGSCGVKDPSALHIDDRAGFGERWAHAVTLATAIAVDSGAASIAKVLTKDGIPRCNLLSPADIRLVDVRWLMRDRIPFGELTLLEGDGGLGKTTLALDILARETRADLMPDGVSRGTGGSVLIVAEEDRGAILKARLLAAGAVLDRVRFVESVGDDRAYLTFPQHVEPVRRAIAETGATVVLIDSLFSHLDRELNAHKSQDVRAVLRPLGDVAHDSDSALIGIRHWNRGAKAAADRGMGSVEFRNVARSVLSIARHPDDDDLYVVAVSKTNLGRRCDALTYVIESYALRGDDGSAVSVGRIAWRGTAAITADELAMNALPSTEELTKVGACADFLRDLLAAASMGSEAAYEAARAKGFPRATTYRAAKRAGVEMRREGFPARSVWSLRVPVVSHLSQSSHPFERETTEIPGDATGPLAAVAPAVDDEGEIDP